MIAAVVVNAGAMDLVDTYENEVSSVQTVMQNVTLFQGPPNQPGFHFNYERTETVYTSSVSGAIDPLRSQMRNLLQLPIYHVWSSDDDIPYLPLQNLQFDQYLQSKNANLTKQIFSNLSDPHSWDLLNPVATLNWCQQYTVNRHPPRFQLNADRSDVFYWATLTQRTGGMISRIDVDAVAATNTLTIKDVANLSKVVLKPLPAALDLTDRFVIGVQNLDSQPLELAFPGMPVPPSYVLEGTAVTDDWSYDMDGFHLTVPASATSIFTVAFDSYTAQLVAPESVPVGTNMALNLQGAVPNKPYLLLIGTSTFPTPLSLFDPNDSRWILVAITPSTILLPSVLNGAAHATLVMHIPALPQYVGVELANQFVTYPGGTTIIDEVSNLAIVRLQ